MEYDELKIDRLFKEVWASPRDIDVNRAISRGRGIVLVLKGKRMTLELQLLKEMQDKGYKQKQSCRLFYMGDNPREYTSQFDGVKYHLLNIRWRDDGAVDEPVKAKKEVKEIKKPRESQPNFLDEITHGDK